MHIQPPAAMLSMIVRWFTWASLWILRRPFVLSRRGWAVALSISLVVAAGGWLLLPWLAAAGLSLVVTVCAGVLVHWAWLCHDSNPVVFVSLFKGRSPQGRDVAETHLGALITFLKERNREDNLDEVVVRRIAVPLSKSQADRLLRASEALMVIRGTGDAAADISRWEWWAHFRDTRPGLFLNKYEFSLRAGESKRRFIRRFRSVSPVSASSATEGGMEISRFVATTINVPHFRVLHKTLSVLASEARFDRRSPEHPVSFVLPEPEDPELTEGLQGRIVILEAAVELEKGREVMDIIGRAQRLFEHGVGDEGFGLWLQSAWFSAIVERWATPTEALEANRLILSRFDGTGGILTNAAGVAVQAGDLEQAEVWLASAAAVGDYEAGVERVRGNIAWQRKEPAVALAAYKRSARDKQGTSLRWQIGDCHAALGNRRRALHFYRVALRHDSTALAAVTHARELLGWPQLLPTFPSGWRSLLWKGVHRHPRLVQPVLWLWRSRRPEDPWIAAWLGRHALIVGDLEIARRWMVIASRRAKTNRLISTHDMLVIGCLFKEDDVPEMGNFLKAHLDWLEGEGLTAARKQVEEIFDLLISARRPPLGGEARGCVREQLGAAGVG